MAIKYLTQNPFTFAMTDFHAKWQSPRKFYYLVVVDEWNTRLQAGTHSGAVDFGKDVTWQVGLEVQILDP